MCKILTASTGPYLSSVENGVAYTVSPVETVQCAIRVTRTALFLWIFIQLTVSLRNDPMDGPLVPEYLAAQNYTWHMRSFMLCLKCFAKEDSQESLLNADIYHAFEG